MKEKITTTIMALSSIAFLVRFVIQKEYIFALYPIGCTMWFIGHLMRLQETNKDAKGDEPK